MISQSDTTGLCLSCVNREYDSYGRIRCKLRDMEIFNVEECGDYAEIKAQPEKDEYAGLNIAGRGKRLINYFLDMAFSFIIFFILVFLYEIDVAYTGSSSSWLENASELEWDILSSLALFVYYIYFETVFNVTPGKLITGTKVVDENGGRPGLKKILIRSLCRYIPFEPLSFFGGDAIGWHDSLSGTVVVNTRKKWAPGPPATVNKDTNDSHQP